VLQFNNYRYKKTSFVAVRMHCYYCIRKLYGVRYPRYGCHRFDTL